MMAAQCDWSTIIFSPDKVTQTYNMKATVIGNKALILLLLQKVK